MLTSQVVICVPKVKGYIELKIDKKILPWENWSSHFKFGSCTSFRFMGYGRQNWHSFLHQLAAILNVPLRPNRLLNSS